MPVSNETERQSPLRDLIVKTAHDVDEFKRPDTDAFKAAINPILEALGRGNLNHESVESIFFGKQLNISTRWSARGCSDTSHYEIPLEIIDAPDPVAAAKKYKYDAEVAKLVKAIQSHEASIVACRAALEQLWKVGP
jgi:Xaa-Pro aminopeptidase